MTKAETGARKNTPEGEPTTFKDLALWLEGFDFGPNDSPQDILTKFLRATRGNYRLFSSRPIIPPLIPANELLTLIEKTSLGIPKELPLLIASHLTIPYLFEQVTLPVLRTSGQLTNSGLRCLCFIHYLTASGKERDYILCPEEHYTFDERSKSIQAMSRKISKQCPRGIFPTREQGMKFLWHFADGLRESLGKTSATHFLLTWTEDGRMLSEPEHFERRMELFLTKEDVTKQGVLREVKDWFSLRDLNFSEFNEIVQRAIEVT